MLLFEGKPFGVLCVGDPSEEAAGPEEDGCGQSRKGLFLLSSALKLKQRTSKRCVSRPAKLNHLRPLVQIIVIITDYFLFVLLCVFPLTA